MWPTTNRAPRAIPLTHAAFSFLFHFFLCAVQEMENTEDRDSELYVDRLEHVLGLKWDVIEGLRKELQYFRAFRAGHERK